MSLYPNQKYNIGDRVYYHYFNYYTFEIICIELEIIRYDYMDGMQWEIIDEYRCERIEYVDYLYLFKKEKRSLFVVNGKSIHRNITVSKVLMLREILEKFGYILYTPDNEYSKNLQEICLIAKEELIKYENEYPDAVLCAIGIGINDSNRHPTR